MPHSFGPLYVHLVFSTRDRERALTDTVHAEIPRYLTPILARSGARLMRVGGTEDHIHLLLDLGRRSSLSTVVREIKSNTSRWISDKNGRAFAWQAGYSGFSVSHSVVPNVVRYIEGQKEHHRKRTFKEEYEAFLRAAKVEYDPKEIWE